ncbi:MAG: hypothetical protein JWL60_628 [Gemmatimonadetes bacterium]|jgi:hypothetical protein|nr:hypothetical protein [Gemmatimonadota bacterium]
MQQTLEYGSAAEQLADVEVLEARFSERTRRLEALMDIDMTLSAAANRHSLAADLVRRLETYERAD